MPSKYGEALTQQAWTGWPLRLGVFDPQGALEGLVAAEDAVLVWSGGRSDVTLHANTQRRLGRQRFTRHAGMIDLMPRGTTLDEVSWKGDPSQCLSVAFDRASLQRVLGKPVELDPEGLRTAITDQHVVDLATRLQEQALLGQPWGTLYVEALSLTLASYVFGRYGGAPAARADERAPALVNQQVQLLIAFVEDHLADNISIVTLAQLIGYSPDHFARLFKRTFGRSPYQYVLERRVERAKQLLRERSLSIAEVAVISGFGSQAHLHAAFKARTGVTPGVYRRG